MRTQVPQRHPLTSCPMADGNAIWVASIMQTPSARRCGWQVCLCVPELRASLDAVMMQMAGDGGRALAL